MHQLGTLHSHFHFIETQSLDVFWTSLAHPQEALHEHSFGECSVCLKKAEALSFNKVKVNVKFIKLMLVIKLYHDAGQQTIKILHWI
jgi:hypothetical protein